MLLPLAYLALTFFVLSIDASNCNPGEIYYAPRELCFSINGVKQRDADFYDAQEECDNRDGGGDLASFHDDVMVDYISQYLNGLFHYWIGAEYRGGGWTWVDGTPWDYSNWDHNEPKAGDYAIMTGSGKFWARQKSSERLSFICSGPALNQPKTTHPTTRACPAITCPVCATTTQKQCTCPSAAPCPTALPCPTAPQSNSNGCPSTWTYYSETQHCYTVFFSSSWDSSEELCQQIGGHVTSIHSTAENAFVSKLTRTYLNATQPLQMTWTGLNYESGLWRWSDSTPVDFINWAAKEPTDTINKKCAMMSQDGSTQAWFTADCDSLMRAYVCKKRVSA